MNEAHDYYSSPEFIEAMDREIAVIKEKKAEITALEAEIQRKMGALPVGASQMIDDPDYMAWNRANGHPYPAEIDELDGLFTSLAAMQESLNRREHDLGYW